MAFLQQAESQYGVLMEDCDVGGDQSNDMGLGEEQIDDNVTGLDKEAFIEALRHYHCLWDTSNPSYKNRAMKTNCWKEFSTLFNRDVQYLQKTFKNLKDTLKKCLDKRKLLTRSDAAATSLPSCKYFESMRFLHDKGGNRPTESNVFIPNALELSTSPITSDDSSALSTHQSPMPVAPPPSEISTASKHKRETKKRKASLDNAMDDGFLTQIKSLDEKFFAQMEQGNDEASSFCLSLVPVLRSFDKKTLRLAKLKINQVLYEIEYGEE